MLAPAGHVALFPGKLDSERPASLDSTNGGGEASDNPRPSKRCVEARRTRVPAASVYREASNDAPTASARAPGANVTGSVGAIPRSRRAAPSGPVSVSP